MKQRHLWLLALLSILTLMTTTTLAIAGEAITSGHVEIGISGMDTDDSPARVNEYVNTRSEEGFWFSPSLSLETIDEGSSFGIEADIMGPRDQQFKFEFDAKRIFRFGLDYQALEHWKDHETLSQMGATGRDDIGGGQPNVTTDAIYADLIGATGNDAITVGGAGLIDAATGELAYDPAAAHLQEISNDYIVTRREWKNEAALALPALPNIVFHAGLRIETRQGMEQAIGLSKCAGCHVSAAGKEIDERTEEFTFGTTGKFGLFTVEYEYMTRDFEERADAPTRWYTNTSADAGGLIKDSTILYARSEEEFGKTPDSEKDSHMLKARVDLPSSTTISASYVQADVESTKTDDPGVFELNDTTLDSEYTGFNGKVATAFGPVRLSLRGGYYEIDGPEYSVTYDQRDDASPVYSYLDPAGNPTTPYPVHTMDNTDDFVSAESREVTEFGIDAVYRLAKATTLRLGYGYENVEREEHFGETETHTFKAAVKTRINKALSGRISYQYEDIEDPLASHTGIAQGYPGSVYDPVSGLSYLAIADFRNNGTNTDPLVEGNDRWVYYWNTVYPSRGLSATNLPNEVHEAKLSTTWAPAANMAATFSMRLRSEENNDVNYEQVTFVPGVSFWYAPSDKLNLTMSYNFNNQDTENRACVGWYHG